MALRGELKLKLHLASRKDEDSVVQAQLISSLAQLCLMPWHECLQMGELFLLQGGGQEGSSSR